MDNLWLPAGYINYIRGSDFLELKQKEGQTRTPLYASRREAADHYLKVMLKGEPSPFHATPK